LRRVDLLRLRFEEGLAIREIARRWRADASSLHHQFAKARQEFKAALLEVVLFLHPEADDPEGECSRLLGLFG
jgi:RNA polymerase sigma-70 factor (ECF subfamily)